MSIITYCGMFLLHMMYLPTERHLQVDRALSQETSAISSDEVSMHQRLSGSMSHDEWRRKTITRSDTGTQIHIQLQEGCERVPTLVHAYIYIYTSLCMLSYCICVETMAFEERNQTCVNVICRCLNK